MFLVCRYVAVYDWAPSLLKIWVPLVMGIVVILTVAIEVRIFYGLGWQDVRRPNELF
jgi:hypothetical protein